MVYTLELRHISILNEPYVATLLDSANPKGSWISGSGAQ